MKKTNRKTANAFSGQATKALILLSLLLVASAVFLSQSDKLFAKAASSNIRGTIVLSDNSGDTNTNTARASGIALPGSSCNIIITACLRDGGENTADAPYRIFLNKQLVPSASIENYANFKQPGYSSYLGACYQTEPTNAPGGLNTVSALQAYVTTQYLSIAYDCTP